MANCDTLCINDAVSGLNISISLLKHDANTSLGRVGKIPLMIAYTVNNYS
jgi:hypothetical protein